MRRNRNLILSWASGEEFCKLDTFQVFCKSLSAVAADKVFFTTSMPDDVADDLESQGIKVLEAPKDQIEYFSRDRYLIYREYLLSYGHKYDYVLTADSKDVIFQQNPFDWIELWKARFDNIQGDHSFLNNFVIFVSEGMKVEQSPWNLIEQFEFQHDVRPTFRKEPRGRWVLNSGIYLGTPDALKNYFMLLWSVHMKTIGPCTEQACLNYLYHFLEEDETYSVTQPWNDTFCLTGEAVKHGHVKPILKDGFLQISDTNPYFLLHQWERTEFKDDLLAHWLR